MAVVINGSGTVTGISVGGLPDGIVDVGTIGADAVTAAKIGDDVIDSEHYAAGSIDTAHIAASQITSAILPAGSLIQIATDYDGSIINMSNNSWNTTNLSIAFTPKRTDSLIVVTAILNLKMTGGGSQHGSAQGQIKKDGSDFGELVWPWCGYGGTEAQVLQQSSLKVQETSGSTSARTYSVSVRNYETQASSDFNPYTGKSSLQIMEIAV